MRPFSNQRSAQPVAVGDDEKASLNAGRQLNQGKLNPLAAHTERWVALASIGPAA
jgi:hypothetical protein